MATVGAVRIGGRIGYFPVVNGKSWEVAYMGREGLLKAIAEALWHEFQGWLVWNFGQDTDPLRMALMKGIEHNRDSVLGGKLASMASDMERALCNPKLEPILYDMAAENGIAAIVPYGCSPRFTLINDEGRLENDDYGRADTLEDFVDFMGYGRQLPDDEDPGTVPQPR